MNKETLRMQMLAGIITDGQYKKEVEEIYSMGKVGKQYAAPGQETSTTTEPQQSLPPKNSNTKNLIKIAGDLYMKMLDLDFYGDDVIDDVIEFSVPAETREKIGKSFNSPQSGVGKFMESDLLTEKDLNTIIKILQSAINLIKKNRDIDFYELEWNPKSEKWYKPKN